MFVFASFVAFSFSSERLAHLAAFLQSTNCSLKLSHSSLTYLRHPFIFLTHRSSRSTLTLFSSHFSRFSNPILHSVDHSLSVSRTTFEVSIARAVTFQSTTEYKSVDVANRHIANSEAVFENCKFHALSSVRGDIDDTSGGAVFSDGFNLVFKSCSFSGNAAVAGGSCAFFRCKASFELCNFTNNRATFEAGVITIEAGKLALNECNFVQNDAELYVGVLKALNSTVDGESLIFHANRAVFHSSVLDLDLSTALFTAAQFSGNTVDNEDGGIVHNLKQSKLKLRGCTFATVPRFSINGTLPRQPIRADGTSQVIIKQGCFDTPEAILREGIDGEYSSSIGTIFADRCECTSVTLPAPYDVMNKELKLADSLLTSRFILTAVGLSILALVIVVLVVCDGSNANSRWVALI
jgi:hypothetical protein